MKANSFSEKSDICRRPATADVSRIGVAPAPTAARAARRQLQRAVPDGGYPGRIWPDLLVECRNVVLKCNFVQIMTF